MIPSEEQQDDIKNTVHTAKTSGAIVLIGVAPAVLGLGYPWYLATLHDFAAERHVWSALLAGGLAYTAGIAFFRAEQMHYAHFIWHLFRLP